MQETMKGRGMRMALLAVMLFSCTHNQKALLMKEEQVTKGHYGHMLNSTQVFSPDDNWVVYDTRNDQTHISRTRSIEKVNIVTGEVVKLYQTKGQTEHGPGVGAVAYHPHENRMIFIHGLLNCDASQPYSFTRRFGALLDESRPMKVIHAEARRIARPLVAGALRGGTHAHSWSGDGEWISFTYNDYLMEQLHAKGGDSKDLRTIGVMSPVRGVKVPAEGAENFSGTFFATVAATVVEKPLPGSNQIEKAFDECWVGNNGYKKQDGTWQRRAIAFQGHLRTKDDSLITEVFVSDVPDDITVSEEGRPLEGTMSTRPSVPKGLKQRRVTFTEERKYPGLQGPRFWLRSSTDGDLLYFLMKDDNGVAQIFECSVHGGAIRKVTNLATDIQGQFNLSPDGTTVALIADNSIWVVDVLSGRSTRLTPRTDDERAPVLAVMWNRRGNMLVYNRYAGNGPDRFLQIYKLVVG